MPWGVARDFEGLVEKVREIKSDAGSKYLVFVHPQRRMDRAGNLLALEQNSSDW